MHVVSCWSPMSWKKSLFNVQQGDLQFSSKVLTTSLRWEKKLLGLCPLSGQTKAKDRFQQLCIVIEWLGMKWNRLVSITTGISTGTEKRREGKWRSNSGSALHYTSTCSKSSTCKHTMSVLLKCVNYTRCRGLKHCQFWAFWEQTKALYVLQFKEVRWLSRGNVLKRFF